ncbi:MAG TPA: site-2 protease family protein [Ignavibacteriales bacterium]|nr:site-2 protease family protein [Ignavibacteriales bacterium]
MPEITIKESLIQLLIFMPLFIISLAVHEFAHAASAYKLGDSTAKRLGRLTLNPIKHLDLIGSVLMPLLAFAGGGYLIGWAKPVPVDTRNFKYPLMDDAIVSFMGPFSNFLLAVVFIILTAGFDFPIYGEITFYGVMITGAYFNIFLFVFNLLPIPPLDGSFILYDLFPNRATQNLLSLGRFGSLLLIIFLFSPLWNYFQNFVNWLFDSVLAISSTVI